MSLASSVAGSGYVNGNRPTTRPTSITSANGALYGPQDNCSGDMYTEVPHTEWLTGPSRGRWHQRVASGSTTRSLPVGCRPAGPAARSPSRRRGARNRDRARVPAPSTAARTTRTLPARRRDPSPRNSLRQRAVRIVVHDHVHPVRHGTRW